MNFLMLLLAALAAWGFWRLTAMLALCYTRGSGNYNGLALLGGATSVGFMVMLVAAMTTWPIALGGLAIVGIVLPAVGNAGND